MRQRVSARRLFIYVSGALSLLILLVIGAIIVSASVGTNVAALDRPVKTALAETQDRADVDTNELNEQLHEEVNEQRRANKRRALARVDALDRAATYHSQDMLNRSYFGTFEPPNQTVADRYRRFNVMSEVPTENCIWRRSAVENLYWSTDLASAANEQAFAESVVESWMSAPNTRSKLLHPDATASGLGSTIGEINGTRYIIITHDLC